MWAETGQGSGQHCGPWVDVVYQDMQIECEVTRTLNIRRFSILESIIESVQFNTTCLGSLTFFVYV